MIHSLKTLIGVNPNFINGTYRLGNLSPALDIGFYSSSSSATPYIQFDLDGRPRPPYPLDLGCYEYDPELDSSANDGVPDAWKLFYGIDAWSDSISTDSDTDGSVDYNEYIAGTNPTDINSIFQIYINNDSKPVVYFNTYAERFYDLFFCTNLVNNQWTTVESDIVGNDSIHYYTNESPSQTGFFKAGAKLKKGN
jgi:hypothetical protein